MNAREMRRVIATFRENFPWIYGEEEWAKMSSNERILALRFLRLPDEEMPEFLMKLDEVLDDVQKEREDRHQEKRRRMLTAVPSSRKDLREVRRNITINYTKFKIVNDVGELRLESSMLKNCIDTLRKSTITEENLAPEQPARELLALVKLLVPDRILSEVNLAVDGIKRCDALVGDRCGIVELKGSMCRFKTIEFEEAAVQGALYGARLTEDDSSKEIPLILVFCTFDEDEALFKVVPCKVLVSRGLVTEIQINAESKRKLHITKNPPDLTAEMNLVEIVKLVSWAGTKLQYFNGTIDEEPEDSCLEP